LTDGARPGRPVAFATGVAVLLSALALLLPVATSLGAYALYLLATGFLWATLASAWSLLAFAGQVSFGHAAFFGAGAYTSALLAQGAAWNPWLGVLAAGAAGAGIAVPIGLATHRLAGAYLALATFAYAEGWRVVALNWTGLTGGGAGLIGIPPLPLGGAPASDGIGGTRVETYYAALALLGLGVVSFAALRGSRVGLAWAAIREREQRAQLLGVVPTPHKLLAFACSGALTALAVALYAHAVRFIEPDLVFGRGMSILPMVMAIFGGLHTLLGPPVGALTLYLASELLLQPTLPRLHQLPYAAALIAVILFLPGGLAGLRRH
jgi:branched-chain amino acid transport system permease protein